jgi:hypothetical protein
LEFCEPIHVPPPVAIANFSRDFSVVVPSRREAFAQVIDVNMPIQGVYSGEMRTNLSSPGYNSLAGVQAFLVLDHISHNAALKSNDDLVFFCCCDAICIARLVL